MKIAVIHYTGAPAIGGVETVVVEHAALLAAHGHQVMSLCGSGDPASLENFQVVAIPELRGDSSTDCFEAKRKRLITVLDDLLRGMDVVFIHNILTMPFNLAATAALWEIADLLPRTHFVAWIHDLAAINPDYHFPTPEVSPWDLLFRRHSRFHYVAVSELRAQQFAVLMNSAPCEVVPNGIDPVAALNLTAPVAKLARDHAILGRDIVLLHPTRIIKRKNIELGLRVVAESKRSGLSCLHLITGPPDLHNADSLQYGDTLRALAKELKIEQEVIFVHDIFTARNADVMSLYQLADVLFFPSKSEGFGLPLLEAAVHRLPVFCADIEPMRSLIQQNVTYFDPEISPSLIAEMLRDFVAASPSITARKKVSEKFSWDAIYSRYLEPMLQRMTP